jgi:hypothetical protein
MSLLFGHEVATNRQNLVLPVLLSPAFKP